MPTAAATPARREALWRAIDAPTLATHAAAIVPFLEDGFITVRDVAVQTLRKLDKKVLTALPLGQLSDSVAAREQLGLMTEEYKA